MLLARMRPPVNSKLVKLGLATKLGANGTFSAPDAERIQGALPDFIAEAADKAGGFQRRLGRCFSERIGEFWINSLIQRFATFGDDSTRSQVRELAQNLSCSSKQKVLESSQQMLDDWRKQFRSRPIPIPGVSCADLAGLMAIKPLSPRRSGSARKRSKSQAIEVAGSLGMELWVMHFGSGDVTTLSTIAGLVTGDVPPTATFGGARPLMYKPVESRLAGLELDGRQESTLERVCAEPWLNFRNR